MKIFKKSTPKKTIFHKNKPKMDENTEKSIKTAVKKLKSVDKLQKSEIPKQQVRIKYKSAQCTFHKEDGTRCNKPASGSSTLCNFHGGNNPRGLHPVPFNTLKPETLGPIKFNPAYHPMKYIDFSRIGMSDAEIAAEFGVSIGTLDKWSTNISEFSLAREIGQTMYEAYFLRVGRCNLSNDRFNTSLFKFLTMNKLGYSDKVESKSQNTSLHGVLLVPPKMTVEEWEQMNIQRDIENAARENADNQG